MSKYYDSKKAIDLKYYFEPGLITVSEIVINSLVKARIEKGEGTSKSKVIFKITNKIKEIDPDESAVITSHYDLVKYFRNDVESTPLPEFPKQGSDITSAMTPTGHLESEKITSHLHFSSFLPPGPVRLYDTWEGLTKVDDPPTEIEVTYTLEDIEEDPAYGPVAKISYHSIRKEIVDERGAIHEVFSFGSHHFALDGYLVKADMNTICNTKSPDADLVSEVNIQFKLL
ncbi:MAG: hypothetical protein K8T10_20295 [Candidatus Eremiobacteraeota bacterium]|nr:hypothetical protein [Candidatus Eremiobacteraeota bacterium]